ncbi:hypothetical protein ACFV6U_05480 [Streptomyces sp. NPDC059810]|uniref:hypothetical protein n=1 Tax=Streptomyces sp. NPDC059810 TaxID=3346956 RepID=UPI003654756C
MTDPVPDRTPRTVKWLRQQLAEDPKASPEVRDAMWRVLDLYEAVVAQARRDDSFLQGWALNADLEGFPQPRESGARTLLPGLTAAIHHLALAYAEEQEGEEPPRRRLASVPTDVSS